MPKRFYDPKATYQTIPQASRTTGLSQHFFRGLKARGELPHLMSGNTTLVNVPELRKQLLGVNKQEQDSSIS